ncbi:MAG: selenoneine synthase SenA [Planctomycetota bacterium]
MSITPNEITPNGITPNELAERVIDARARSIELIADLSDEQLSVPYLATINPLLWEACHQCYFQEFWALRQGAGQAPWRADVDDLFDSMKICHENRWRLAMPSRSEAMDYLHTVQDRVVALLRDGGPLEPQQLYYIAYSVAHEDIHTEALTYTRQTLGYPAPRISHCPPPPASFTAAAAHAGVECDVEIPGGTLSMGAQPGEFCHDNEKWAHPVEVGAFGISKTAVTDGQMAAFVDDGGYQRRELWTVEGWAWRLAESAEYPLYWRRGSNGFERRSFDQWAAIDEQRAACHISWYEADAYCRWAKRRLPTEAEWEAATCAQPGQSLEQRPQCHPWGSKAPDSTRANLDWSAMGPVDVRSCAAGDSPCGVRQLTGNVWEWTSSTFEPYPGFVPDMYVDYSQTSFCTRKVLRGGCWATRSRLIRNTFRNFYQQSRRDVFAGFRTCPPNESGKKNRG